MTATTRTSDAADQGPRVVRMVPGVKEDQVPRLRANNRTVVLYGTDAGSVRIMRENQLAARRMIRAEEHAGQRVGVDMTFESLVVPRWTFSTTP